MKIILLLLALLMVLLGLTGILWPEGLMELARYGISPTGLYVAAAVRIIAGGLLFIGAGATRMPKTVRVIGAFMAVAGIATLLIGTQRAQSLIEPILAHGPDFFRVLACLPLVVGVLVGGSAVTKGRA